MLLALQASEFVSELYRGRWLDKKRLPASARIVDQALHLRAVLRFHGQGKSAVSHRDDRLLQILLIGRALDHVVELFPHFLVCQAHLPSDSCKCGRGVVRDLILRKNAARDLLFHRPMRRKAVREHGKQPLRISVLQNLPRTAAHPQALRDLKQLARGQRQRSMDPAQRIPHVGEALYGGSPRAAINGLRLFRLLQHPFCRRKVGNRMQRIRFLLSHRGSKMRFKDLQYLIVFQCVQYSRVHNISPENIVRPRPFRRAGA